MTKRALLVYLVSAKRLAENPQQQGATGWCLRSQGKNMQLRQANAFTVASLPLMQQGNYFCCTSTESQRRVIKYHGQSYRTLFALITQICGTRR